MSHISLRRVGYLLFLTLIVAAPWYLNIPYAIFSILDKILHSYEVLVLPLFYYIGPSHVTQADYCLGYLPINILPLHTILLFPDQGLIHFLCYHFYLFSKW